MDAYREHIADVHRRLGIPADYAERTGLSLQREPDELVAVSPGRSDRRQWLAPAAAARWARLEAAAETAGIVLRVVSSYRSVDYQAGLIERKLERGEAIDDILRVNAAPGYSEHHSGRAVDLGVAGCAPLTEAFEGTAAFAWLQAHAGDFGFVLSYPRDNAHGIVYEPWHWAVPAVDA
ncbi:MAG: M15 family metallopeptidase [Halofilum sp. (in: g-proteobacteria)]|nr:M15 family metallopeptidase [Halofilum sp. (in: g-proteobacteria)]